MRGRSESGAAEGAETSPLAPGRDTNETTTNTSITVSRERARSGPAEELSLTFQAFDGHDEWLM